MPWVVVFIVFHWCVGRLPAAPYQHRLMNSSIARDCRRAICLLYAAYPVLWSVKVACVPQVNKTSNCRMQLHRTGTGANVLYAIEVMFVEGKGKVCLYPTRSVSEVLISLPWTVSPYRWINHWSLWRISSATPGLLIGGSRGGRLVTLVTPPP